MKTVRFLLLGSALLTAASIWLAGCSGSEDKTTDGTTPTTTNTTTPSGDSGSPPSGTSSVAVPETPTDGSGTLYGVVKFEGTPPKSDPVNVATDPGCQWFYKDNPLLKEDVVIGEGNSLRYTYVHIKGNVAGTHSVPKDHYLVDQVKCIFIPHVSGVMVGQTVRFRNSDPVVHNTRTNAKINKFFNATQPKQGDFADHAFDKEEYGIKLVCDVHPWMASYIHVSPHPFFAVSGEDGSYVIKGLPPGKYTLEFIHEKLGEKTVEVEVKANEATQTDMTYSVSS
ncbi:MAG: hypothetical protein KIT45_00930 [Fimbriimonadia bacterium]|nr:hypothetical protein [Fimbriimonadia bacterium]